MGSPYQYRSREPLAPGGAWGTRVTLLWVFREGGAACSGRGRSQEKDEGLQAQDAGRQEAAHHWCHSGLGGSGPQVREQLLRPRDASCPCRKQGGGRFRIPMAETLPVALMSWLPSGGPAAPSLHANPCPTSPAVGLDFF